MTIIARTKHPRSQNTIRITGQYESPNMSPTANEFHEKPIPEDANSHTVRFVTAPDRDHTMI